MIINIYVIQIKAFQLAAGWYLVRLSSLCVRRIDSLTRSGPSASSRCVVTAHIRPFTYRYTGPI